MVQATDDLSTRGTPFEPAPSIRRVLMDKPNSWDERTLPLTVQNIGFLLDRLGEDCHPLQFLRELTQNSIEAILRTPDNAGSITWDVDWLSYELVGGPFKLCVIDTGDGMTGEEMVRYINQLSSSLAEQSFAGNYGVGAKIAAATRNRAGLIYQSWKHGEGAMIHLWRDPATAQYGLRRFERPDGSYGHYTSIEDLAKPDQIKDHGTKIILYGNAESDDTLTAPEGSASPSRWISKYLNGRYFRFPDSVDVRAREGWTNPLDDRDRNVLRRLSGQEQYLASHSTSSGVIELTGARAHWWILKDESAIGQNSGYIESSGHVAALYRDEMYETATGRSGIAMLQRFGVIVGSRRVVIYVEPTQEGGARLTTTTARTNLLLNNTSLPWSEWALEFREQMPDEIETLMEEVASGTTSTNQAHSIRERLKDIIDLYRVSRYRISPTGPLMVDGSRRTRGGSPREQDAASRTEGGRSGTEGGTAGGVYSVFQKKDGVPGRAVRPDVFPDIIWISIKDGTREAGDLEDRAARFLLEQNKLLVNADFRVFNDMISRWERAYESKPGVREAVQETVRGWFAQALVETVIGIQALKDSKEWTIEEIEKAISPEGLTAVVMSRYHVNHSVKRELGTKLGKLQVA
jgi:hypothetical protein